jgi:hypothetical protein
MIAVSFFIFSAVAFLTGFITEYRQSRAKGPIAIVPTVPYPVAASIFVLFGLIILPTPMSCWIYLLAFVASVTVFGFLTIRIAKR